MDSDVGTSSPSLSFANMADDDRDADSWFARHCVAQTAATNENEMEMQMQMQQQQQLLNDTHNADNAAGSSANPELEMYYCLRNNEFRMFLPLVALFTLVTNCLVSAVLLQRHMVTPVNVLLLAISMFNMLTGTSPIPVLMHFYSFRNYRDYVSYSWCFWYHFLIDFVPTLCHTTSIWLTVFVALQRYIYICKPQSASHWCTIRVSTTSVLVTLGIAVLYYLPVLFEKRCVPIETASLRYPNTTIVALGTVNREWLTYSFHVYIGARSWSRFLFVNFLPSGTLIVFTVLLIREIRKASRRRRVLLSRDRDAQSSDNSNSTTLMLLAIVFLFLLVEIPPGIAFLLFLPTALYAEAATVIISFEDYLVVALILNIGVLLSYPINFFIYCAMSKQFRETFYSLFTGKVAAAERSQMSRSKSRTSSKSAPRSRTATATRRNEQTNGDSYCHVQPDATAPALHDHDSFSTSNQLKNNGDSL